MQNQLSFLRTMIGWLWVPLTTAGSTVRAFSRIGMGWLVPVAILLFVLALILAVLGATSTLAPFVYPLI